MEFSGGGAEGAGLGAVEFWGGGFGDDPAGYGDGEGGFTENGPEGGEGGIFVWFDAVEEDDRDGGRAADGVVGVEQV